MSTKISLFTQWDLITWDLKLAIKTITVKVYLYEYYFTVNVIFFILKSIIYQFVNFPYQSIV